MVNNVRREQISVHFYKSNDDTLQKNSETDDLGIDLICVSWLDSKAIDSWVTITYYNVTNIYTNK